MAALDMCLQVGALEDDGSRIPKDGASAIKVRGKGGSKGSGGVLPMVPKRGNLVNSSRNKATCVLLSDSFEGSGNQLPDLPARKGLGGNKLVAVKRKREPRRSAEISLPFD